MIITSAFEFHSIINTISFLATNDLLLPLIPKIKELPLDRIIDKSYETAIKDEFKSLCYHEFNTLSNNDIKFLIKKNNLYKHCMIVG